MQQLFSTRYFSRVWVIQEVALARVAYLIVNDEELLLTSTVLDRLSLLCAESRHCKLPGVFERLLVQDTRPEVLSCLYTGWQCLATDRRDCVFAVLSLMPPEIRSLIPVDYSMSLKAVKRSSCNHRNSAESRHPIACQISVSRIVHVWSNRPRRFRNIPGVVGEWQKFVTLSSSTCVWRTTNRTMASGYRSRDTATLEHFASGPTSRYIMCCH